MKKRRSASSALRGSGYTFPCIIRRAQRVRGHVDELDLIGERRGSSRARSPAAGSPSRSPHVVQALDVLDVQGRDDLDALRQDVEDVLPPFRASHARNVRVRELVDEGDVRVFGGSPASVSISWRSDPAILDRHRRNDLQPFERAPSSSAGRTSPRRRPRRGCPRSSRRCPSSSIAYVLPTPGPLPGRCGVALACRRPPVLWVQTVPRVDSIAGRPVEGLDGLRSRSSAGSPCPRPSRSLCAAAAPGQVDEAT